MRVLKIIQAANRYSDLKIYNFNIFLYLMLFILYTNYSYAQESFSLQDAWAITLQNNFTLEQQEKLISRAAEEISIQKSEMLPTLSAGGLYNYQSALPELQLPFPGADKITAGTYHQYDLNLSLNQKVFSGFRTHNLIKAAQEQHHSKSLQKQTVTNQLLLQVGRVFYEIQFNLLQQDVIEQSIQRANNQLLLLRNLLAAEQVTPFDTLEVANRKLQLHTQLTTLENTEIILLSKLAYLMNVQEAPRITPLKLHTSDLTLGDLQDYQNQAFKQRPELQNNAALQRAQSFRSRTLQASYYPQIFARAAYHYARPGVNFFQDEWMDYYTITFNFQWKLWSWKRNYRKVQQSRLDFERLDLEIQQLQHDISQQVKEAYQNLLSVRDQIRLQEKLADQERMRYQLTHDRYEQGLVTSLDLSSAEHALTEAELILQKNYISWYQQQLNLKLATGTIGNL
jgi:outer membrane protein TolC